MQLTRRQESWDPFREIEELSARLNRFFGSPRLKGNGEREAMAVTAWAPSCDISETDREYRIHAELPNLRKSDVHVSLEGGVLTIQGERREEKEEKGVKVHRRELTYGTFMRQFSMPADADESKIDASFVDGMLNIVIAKSKTKVSGAKEIAIH